mmetsp:Transcript_29036/g.74518  ORF Transcript_29036/g.74518 Transcript_29036/m.74518 type:complete len:302 (+) Transcript_29036:172-1077(+)
MPLDANAAGPRAGETRLLRGRSVAVVVGEALRRQALQLLPLRAPALRRLGGGGIVGSLAAWCCAAREGIRRPPLHEVPVGQKGVARSEPDGIRGNGGDGLDVHAQSRQRGANAISPPVCGLELLQEARGAAAASARAAAFRGAAGAALLCLTLFARSGRAAGSGCGRSCGRGCGNRGARSVEDVQAGEELLEGRHEAPLGRLAEGQGAESAHLLTGPTPDHECQAPGHLATEVLAIQGHVPGSPVAALQRHGVQRRQRGEHRLREAHEQVLSSRFQAQEQEWPPNTFDPQHAPLAQRHLAQ